MYLVGRMFEKKGANTMVIELPSECIGLMPIYKTKKAAVKYSLDYFPIYEMDIKTQEQK